MYIFLPEVLSFKLQGLTICHDLSWESHISNLASKASPRLCLSLSLPTPLILKNPI